MHAAGGSRVPQTKTAVSFFWCFLTAEEASHYACGRATAEIERVGLRQRDLIRLYKALFAMNARTQYS